MNNLIKTLIVAFIISIFIHFLLYITINKTFNNSILKVNTSTKDNSSAKGIISIKYVKIKPQEQIKEVKNNTIKTTKKVLKQKIEKKVIKKEKLDLKKFFIVQKEEKNKKKKEELKKTKKRQKEVEEIKRLPELTQSYIKLYGEEFFELSESKRRYLKQNLNKIGQITEKHLRYPRVSVRTKQQGVNVVEFYFHPNGDITDLRITNSSQYTALDENTIYTIKIAYQDYPRPLEKIKIIIHVIYTLFQ